MDANSGNGAGLSPSRADEVALPVRIVELSRLKTAAGDPVRVRCEFVDEFTLLDITRSLQGLPIGAQPPAEEGDEREQMEKYGHPIIEAGTALEGPDGSLVRPAFWFKVPVAGAVPGRFLSVADRQLLFTTIMEVSGWAGGPAEKLAFPDDGAGRANGGGAVGGHEDAREIGAGTLP